MRSLYKTEYLESGCTIEFEEVYRLDDTFGTYATNFAIFVVCFIAIVMQHCFRTQKQDKSSINKYMTVFFGFNMLAFGIAGINHAFIHRTDHPWKEPLERIAGALFGISNMCLALVSVAMLTNKVFVWRITALICIGITVYAVATNALLLIGIFQLIVLPFVSVVYGIEACKHALDTANITKAGSTLLLLSGLLIQILLAPACGDRGYEACFQDCPLPNPSVFNHNGLFHVVYMVGLIFLAVAEYHTPSPSTRTIGTNGIDHAIKTVEQESSGVMPVGYSKGHDDNDKDFSEVAGERDDRMI